MSTKTIKLSGLALAGILMPATLAAAPALADSAKTGSCTVSSVGNVTVAGGVASASFNVAGCDNAEVSFVSYTAPNLAGTPYDKQSVYKSTTATYKSGQHTVTIALPNCYYQVDLVTGKPLTSFANGVTYHGQGRYVNSLHGGTKVCVTSTPTPTPHTPTPTPTPVKHTPTPTPTPGKGGSTPTPTPTVTPVPTVLPDTGAEAMLPISAMGIAGSALAYVKMRRRNR